MRDIALLLCTTGALAAVLRFPFVGVLLWIWFAIANPHRETYGFAHTLPWNLIIAVVTIIAWLASSERKLPPRGATTVLVLSLLAWTTINTFFAFDPSWSWVYWDRAWKTVFLGVLAGTLTTTKVRFQALLWVVVLSLGYYGVKGGVFTLLTGGTSHVWGPSDTMIADNNILADALVMTLPIMNYLRLQSESRLIRVALIGSICLVTASILGSYSREAYIALSMLAVAFWLKTKNKLVYPAVAAVVIVPLLKFMPDSFYERVNSIQHYGTDSSFQTRVDSWWVSYRYAMDHFPFGAGFYGLNLPSLWEIYIPGGEWHAAHSIYFQVLGEQGVPGLLLYLMIIAFTFLNLRAVRRDTKRNPAFAWANQLANMLQLSLLAFCIGGAAAPIDFFDLFFVWAMLSAILHEMTRKQRLALPSRVQSSRDFSIPAPASSRPLGPT